MRPRHRVRTTSTTRATERVLTILAVPGIGGLDPGASASPAQAPPQAGMTDKFAGVASGAYSYALGALDKVAGPSTRNRVEHGVDSLTNSASSPSYYQPYFSPWRFSTFNSSSFSTSPILPGFRFSRVPVL